MACLLHTDMTGQSPDEYFVGPFDPCPEIKCQCPGGCPGILRLSGTFRSGAGLLDCDVCGHGYIAPLPKETR